MMVPLITDPQVLRHVYCGAPHSSRMLLWNTMAPIRQGLRCYLGYAFWELESGIRPLFTGRIKTPRGMAYDDDVTLGIALKCVLYPEKESSVHQRQWLVASRAAELRGVLAVCTANKEYRNLFFDIDNRVIRVKS